MNDDVLRGVFERAAEIAKSVPEYLREAAFNRAVEALLPNTNQPTLVNKKDRLRSDNATVPEKNSEPNVSYLLDHIDRTAYPAVSDSTRVLDRALHILRIANDDYDLDGLGPTDIARILTEKFRLRTTRQAVAQALDAARKYVDRFSSAGRAKYRIMAAGERYLDSNDSDSTNHQSNRRGKVAKKTAKKAVSESGPSTSTSDRKRSSTRIGPRAALNQLIVDGYFNSTRRISEIQTHLAETKAHTYKVTDLSPTLVRMLRDNVLMRERGEDGQYEYRRQ